MILVGIYNQQFQGTILLMIFDFQGILNLYKVFRSFSVITKLPFGVTNRG